MDDFISDVTLPWILLPTSMGMYGGDEDLHERLALIGFEAMHMTLTASSIFQGQRGGALSSFMYITCAV